MCVYACGLLCHGLHGGQRSSLSFHYMDARNIIQLSPQEAGYALSPKTSWSLLSLSLELTDLYCSFTFE